MPYPTVSPPWCLRCGADESDGIRLYSCSLSRSYTDATGVRRSSSTPVRVCRPCIEVAMVAVARVRASGVVNHAGRHRRPHRVRPVGRLGTAERAAERLPAIVRLDGLEPDQAVQVCALVAAFRAERRALPEQSGIRLAGGRFASSRTSADASFAAAADG
jgi:hypothetical protein